MNRKVDVTMTAKPKNDTAMLIPLALLAAVGVFQQRIRATDKPPVAISVVLAVGVVLALAAAYGLSRATPWAQKVGMVATVLIALVAVGGLLQSTVPGGAKVGIAVALALAVATFVVLLRLPRQRVA